MLTKPFLAISLLASLVAVSGAANASTTKRHWSSAGAHRDVRPHGEVRESFAPIANDIAPSRGDSQSAWRYHGGPKSAF
jgi:hypothetical protein